MIRTATPDDLPKLLEWGRHFAESVDLPGGYDPESAEGLFRQLMDAGILLIGEGGAVGAFVHPSPYNAAHVTGQELFWWVEPEHRGNGTGKALFDALQVAVAEAGAGSFTMSTLGDHGIGRFYESRGYRQTDQNYTKTF